MIQAFIHGFLLAFGLVMPLGIQNVFVFNQGAAHKNWLRAIPAIATASVCDGALILLAVTGVSLIVLQFAWLKTLLYGFGFFFLIFIGYSLWKSAAETSSPEKEAGFSPRRQILFAASASLLNPHAILDTIGVIGTSSLGYEGREKWVFTAACILVSCIWFILLAAAGRLTGSLDRSGHLLTRLNQASALLIWGIALYMGWQLVN
ncbi:LysE/ArgO family amino acid transporter [Paludifilum halophilum]|uniref:Lysine transporter LysE n=1 Tax=Paludifilum halophilum TaxID=1642702 RepID=A0A235B4T6_9BACL|nr:LysE family transporter [Paludifilum halophilum]OYD07320.1 lysine transporter LysE [Paludifilum halophilum]